MQTKIEEILTYCSRECAALLTPDNIKHTNCSSKAVVGGAKDDGLRQNAMT